MHHCYPGRLLSLEGIDGSGKSTLAKSLATALEQKNRPVLLTKEPGGSSLGKELRAILHAKKGAVCSKSEYLLFAADRAQHFQEIIIPALTAGTTVIADRLADSSLAYQGYGRGLDCEMITIINRWAMDSIVPDLTLYIKIDPQTALARVMQRNEALTSFEQEKLDFWQRVCRGYEAIFAQRSNVITLDGRQTQDALLQQALQSVMKLAGQ